VAIVRCPVHKIPYNDANPRGCPACAREGARDESADVIRELAGANIPVVEVIAPRSPTAPEAPSWLDRALALARARRFHTLGIAAIAVLIGILAVVSGPRYVDAPNPAPADGAVRPLLIEPNAAISAVFTALGTPRPEPVPDEPQLARYRYGAGLVIDAYNQHVHRIAFSLPNRSWKGIGVGVPERTVRGALALLGAAREASRPQPQPPESVSGFAVYSSLDARPRRALLVEVRAPNGCFDVQVVLRPQVVGALLKGSNRYAVIGERDAVPQWVSTEVRITSRVEIGPDGAVAGCG
jgi:hypothetical protein